MEFLPIISNGQKVYAGFWRRFWAHWLDMLIMMPITPLIMWLKGFDRNLAIVLIVMLAILFTMYNVFFNVRFGGTPGKLAVGIRITKPNGSRIDWLDAWKRYAVNLVFVFISTIVEVWRLTQVDPGRYASLGWVGRAQLVREHDPSWLYVLFAIGLVWFASEVVVLLSNKRKRAIHDFIGGTVVIRKKFAEQESGRIRN